MWQHDTHLVAASLRAVLNASTRRLAICQTHPRTHARPRDHNSLTHAQGHTRAGTHAAPINALQQDRRRLLLPHPLEHIAAHLAAPVALHEPHGPDLRRRRAAVSSRPWRGASRRKRGASNASSAPLQVMPVAALMHTSHLLLAPRERAPAEEAAPDALDHERRLLLPHARRESASKVPAIVRDSRLLTRNNADKAKNPKLATPRARTHDAHKYSTSIHTNPCTS